MKEQQNNYILLQGIFLISVLFFSLLVSSLLFMFRIPISNVNLLLAVLCSVAVTFYFSDKSIKKTAITAAVGLVIIVACVFLCMHVYDLSWDGNSYRKARTGLLKYGWNPLYETFFEYQEKINLSGMEVNNSREWYDTSPKASEIIAANFYAVTNDIEAGKCYTILVSMALFFICYAFLNETQRLKKWQILCCALFCVLNPVALSMCVTNYNDAFLTTMILLCLVALFYLTFYEKQKYDLLSWYFIFISINIGFNIKLSMPLFLAILCLSFCGYWFFTTAKQKGIYKTILYYRKHFVFFVVSVLSGFFITGSTYYISNFLHYGHPFGGASTGGIAAEITNQLPVVYKDMSNIERFICSLFSRTNDSRVLDTVEWKIPLTFTKSEFLATQKVDVRTAGWGIFFSAIFLISILVIFFSLTRKNGLNNKIKHITVYLFVIFGLSIYLIPGLSLARYDAFVFFIPVTALLFIFLNWENNVRIMYCAMWILVILLCLNLTPNILKNYQLFKEYTSIDEQVLEFRSIAEKNEVIVSIGDKRYFYGRLFNLYDKGITKFQFGDVDRKNCTGTLFSDWGRVYYDVIPSSDSKETADVIYEDMSEDKLEQEIKVDKNNFSLVSAGYEQGNMASIKLNDVEYALNKRGLNIVVYDKNLGSLIDSVRIDTYVGDELTR